MQEQPQATDTTVAEAYEAYMVPGMFAHWTRLAVGVADPKPGEHVLDVACGTGVGARTAAAHARGAGRVAGLDMDPGVIALARRLTSGSATPIEWQCASALKMPYGEAEFDLCLCLQGLQFFPDRGAGFAEMRRVLKAGGRLVATIWDRLECNKGHEAVVRALESQGVDATAARRACSFADPAAIRETALRAGFRTVDLRTEEGVSHFASMQSFFDGMTQGSPSTRHAVGLLPAAGRERFVAEVTSALRPYLVNGELRYPMRAHVLVARP